MTSLARAFNERLSGRLALGGLGQLLATASLTVLPFLGRGYLTTGDFAFWTLMVTVSSTTVVLDFGGVPLILASQEKSARFNRLFALALGLSCGGAVLIGAIAVGAWLLYAGHQSAISTSFGVVQIGLVTLGGVMRSAVACSAASALAARRMTARTWLFGSQAVAQISVTWIFLAVGVRASAFSLGLCVSSALALISAVQVLVAISAAHAPGPERRLIPGGERAGAFFGWRTAAILLGAFITQADRWAIGAIAGALVLANYEIAYRIATVPKIVALALGVGLTSETARLGGAADMLDALYRRSMRLATYLLAGCAVAVVPLGIAVIAIIRSGSLTHVLILVIPLTVAHCANGLTAPGTYMCLGIAKPILEVPYLAGTAALMLAGWLVAAFSGSGTIATAAPMVAIALGSAYFLWYFPRRLTAAVPG